MHWIQPIQQVQSTEQFLTRAKKRLEVAEKEVVACTEKRDSLRVEMVSAEERLARLKDEVGRGGQDGHPVPNPQFHIPPEVTAELDRLRSMVANASRPRFGDQTFEGTGGSVAGALNP